MLAAIRLLERPQAVPSGPQYPISTFSNGESISDDQDFVSVISNNTPMVWKESGGYAYADGGSSNDRLGFDLHTKNIDIEFDILVNAYSDRFVIYAFAQTPTGATGNTSNLVQIIIGGYNGNSLLDISGVANSASSNPVTLGHNKLRISRNDTDGIIISVNDVVVSSNNHVPANTLTGTCVNVYSNNGTSYVQFDSVYSYIPLTGSI